MMKNLENQMNWLKNEIKKDDQELNREKLNFINEIKNHKKEEILPKKTKLTLWQRIKMTFSQF